MEELDMKTVQSEVLRTNRVVFEPGNATRYELLITKIEGRCLVMTDLNTKQVVLFHPDYFTADGIEVTLYEAGYSRGDARPMAEYLEDSFRELAHLV